MEKEKIYKIGYAPGVYDLFHIGHLNLIRRAKEQSEYLLVGVLCDELVVHFKGKNRSMAGFTAPARGLCLMKVDYE